MKNTIRSFFTSSYPLNIENNGRVALYTSLFISAFLLFFQPFGLANLDIPHKNIVLSAYGIVTFIVLFLNIVILPNYLKNIFCKKTWTVGKQFVFLFWILFCIGLGNYLYSSYVFHFSLFNLYYLAIFEFFTLGVGIIPIFVILLWKNNTYLKEHLRSAEELNQKINSSEIPEKEKPTLLNFVSYNNKDKLQIDEDDVLFIESEGNYCTIYYVNNKELRKKVLRNTLKNIVSNLPENTLLFRSHRAYIINPKQIYRIKGNAQGYKLYFNYTSKEAAVSRRYIKEFKEIINSYNQ
ncbi:MAG: LytTR family transcriptional regulator [Bacteroidales bacterium]|nr:LytTR family transcriptional regulator [Bacteroidales bacterium]